MFVGVVPGEDAGRGSQLGEGSGNRGVVVDITAIEVGHTEEALEFLSVTRGGEVRDCGNLRWHGGKTLSGNDVTKEGCRFDKEFAFGHLSVELVLAKNI